MENASKALLIAGSTLMAVILITIFVVFIGEISIWPQTEDQIENTEQIATFNAEYETYQKSAMYGVDVISCLNKAKSNNEKYEEGGSTLDRYQINVIVTIKEALTESITVTAIQSLASGGYKETSVLGNSDIVENTSGVDLALKDVFDINEANQLTNFGRNNSLKYNMSNTSSGMNIGHPYELTAPDKVLEKLLKHSNNIKQIVKNKEDDANYIYNASENSYGWSTATWTTYLYNFKQKRFKCVNLEYSSTTGRVNKLEFEEI